MKLHVLLLLLVSPLALAKAPNIDKVNGSIRTEAGVEYGNLDTVNGSIVVNEGVVARKVSTVNGSITIRANAALEKAETVNGSIGVDQDVTVRGELETVNGAIRADKGSTIGGSIETVNGSMRLRGVNVEGDLTTVNGSMDLSEGAVIRGGITVKKPTGFGWNFNRKLPRITLGANVVVHGNLQFDQEVELDIHPSAKTGKILGVAPVRVGAGVER